MSALDKHALPPAHATQMAKSYMPYARRYPSYTNPSLTRYSGNTTSAVSYYSSSHAAVPYTCTDTYMRRISTPSNTSKHYASTGSTKLSSNHRVLPPSPIGHTTNYGTDRYAARRVVPKTDARSTSRKPMKCDHSVQMTKVHSPNTSSLGTYGTQPRLSRKDRTNSYSELNQITADLHHTTLSDAPDVSLRRSKKYSSSYDVTSSSSSCSSADRSRTTPNGVGTQNYDETNDSLPDIQPPRSLRPSSMDRSQRSSSTDHYYGSAGTASKAVLDGGARVQQGSSSLAYQTEVSWFYSDQPFPHISTVYSILTLHDSKIRTKNVNE